MGCSEPVPANFLCWFCLPAFKCHCFDLRVFNYKEGDDAERREIDVEHQETLHNKESSQTLKGLCGRWWKPYILCH